MSDTDDITDFALPAADPHACVRCGKVDCICTAVVPVASIQRASRAAWLAERQHGVGSSDAPCLVGLGHRSAADIYRDKTEPPDERPSAGLLRRGLDLEDIIAARYVEVMDTGCELAKPAGIRWHPDRPWQLATIDRERDDGRIVELKSTAGFGSEWGPAGSDIVPEGYLVQVQHQMGVVGADWCDVAALDVIAWEFRVYRVPFDRAFFAFLTEVEAEFWMHVTARIPLDSDWRDRFAGGQVRPVKGKTIELGDEIGDLIAQRKKLTAIAKEADVAKRHLEARILAVMGDADRATAGGWNVKRISVKPKHVEAYDADGYSYIRCDRAK